jgi:hypothetical protein
VRCVRTLDYEVLLSLAGPDRLAFAVPKLEFTRTAFNPYLHDEAFAHHWRLQGAVWVDVSTRDGMPPTPEEFMKMLVVETWAAEVLTPDALRELCKRLRSGQDRVVHGLLKGARVLLEAVLGTAEISSIALPGAWTKVGNVYAKPAEPRVKEAKPAAPPVPQAKEPKPKATAAAKKAPEPSKAPEPPKIIRLF